MFVLSKEPFPNMSAADIKVYFADKHTDADLADAYAAAHNKFWWVVDNVYDHKEGTPEHKIACAIAGEWRSLMDVYREKIFEILSSEGVVIPKTEQVEVLEPFMARFGYIDGNGWWIKQETAE